MMAKSFAILKFSPSDYLEFINCPVLIPGQKLFTITNNYDREVLVNSVSSESSNFHAVMFQPALLQPFEEMKIQILFLPYYAETVNSVLNINTSEGDVQYSITGRAVPNPYKLHPYLGQRLQHGAVPYEHPIVIYNPYKEALFIREVFTTEDFLSLKGSPLTNNGDIGDESELHSVLQENGTSSVTSTSAFPALWTVDPGFEKEIIVLSMTASTTGMFSGYVHIKTSRDNIVLPVELQVRLMDKEFIY